MKNINDVSSIKGLTTIVYGGSKDHRKAYISELLNLLGSHDHLDTVTLDGSEKNISVDQVRTMIQSTHYSSLSPNSTRVYIFYSAESLSHTIQNTLLKTFEEVSSSQVVILEAQSYESFIPTIVSRAFMLAISGEFPPDAGDVVDFQGKKLGELFRLAEDYSENADMARKLISHLLLYTRSRLHSQTSNAYTNYCDFLLTQYGLIGSTNTSLRLLLENCLLNYYSLFVK